MKSNETTFWPGDWADPSGERMEKPRNSGLTMVIDKGLGIVAFEDAMKLCSPFVDVYKLGFGTSVLYPVSLLQKKVELARLHQLDIMPGGTFFEIARRDKSVEEYLFRIREIGFNAVEISDGSLPLTRKQRNEAIALAKECGLRVYTEYGKKVSGFTLNIDHLAETLYEDIHHGADYVIVEARDSGTVGLYDRNGDVDEDFVREAALACGNLANRLIWEAPQKSQQVILMKVLGRQVNLGNIPPADILAVESMRRGLRGDTCAWPRKDDVNQRCE